MRMKIIALDIGGTSIKSCLAERCGAELKILDKVRTTPLFSKEFAELKQFVLSLCERYLENGADKIIGISTTGSVDNNETVVSAGHFKDYRGVKWGEMLLSKFGAKVKVVNDGRASAWGEYAAMLQKPHCHVHAVVGTGVGGGIIIGGKLLKGVSGQAGYIGHIKIDVSSNLRCSCGMTGCVEIFASAKGMAEKYSETVSGITGFKKMINLFESDSERIFDVVKNGGYKLGVALGNVANIIGPEVITIGGGVMAACNTLVQKYGIENPYLPGVKEGLSCSAHRRPLVACIITEGALCNNAGLLGVAGLAASD